MMKRTVHVLVIVTLLAVVGLMSGCAWKSKIMFPAADEIFVTTGDGDITKPYTPVGQLIYIEQGFRIPFIFLGMLPVHDVDPDMALKTKIYSEVRSMGGDALINMSIIWSPPSNGFLGMFANGGKITVYGTVIRR
ncbi:MAG: hypothetical protein DRP47_03765 [Candidatus Zixiibacteriota bacterium]|nr:MAG: hypothetical protein DRP47_03765 [candidate division Zixibacteria bacterium]